jgi:hypothetical protein
MYVLSLKSSEIDENQANLYCKNNLFPFCILFYFHIFIFQNLEPDYFPWNFTRFFVYFTKTCQIADPENWKSTHQYLVSTLFEKMCSWNQDSSIITLCLRRNRLPEKLNLLSNINVTAHIKSTDL